MHEIPTLLRRRGGHEGAKVEMVELFFDLVFVFAVTQLSHTLLRNLTLAGAAQVGLLLVAVWWVWVYTSWVTNWLNPERMPVRITLFVLMLAGLVVSASIPDAFKERGLLFACAFAFMHVVACASHGGSARWRSISSGRSRSSGCRVSGVRRSPRWMESHHLDCADGVGRRQHPDVVGLLGYGCGAGDR